MANFDILEEEFKRACRQIGGRTAHGFGTVSCTTDNGKFSFGRGHQELVFDSDGIGGRVEDVETIKVAVEDGNKVLRAIGYRDDAVIQLNGESYSGGSLRDISVTAGEKANMVREELNKRGISREVVSEQIVKEFAEGMGIELPEERTKQLTDEYSRKRHFESD